MSSPHIFVHFFKSRSMLTISETNWMFEEEISLFVTLLLPEQDVY